MRRLAVALVAVGAVALIGAPADAKKHRNHKPSGVAGVVLDSTCAGACAEPPPPAPTYTGAVTITVQRVSDGQQVASQAASEGHFRIRLKRGTYNVSSVTPTLPPCEPTPQTVCPLAKTQSPAIVVPCMTGETKQITVRGHRFTQVELHVSNTCIV